MLGTDRSRSRTLSRRSFLKSSAAAAGGLWFTTRINGVVSKAYAAIPGGTLDPLGVTKYATPLLIPPQMPRAGIKLGRRGLVDYYEIAMRQFDQQILPAGQPATTVWGYGPSRALSRRAPMIYNAPSLTIEANYGRPVRVKWINELVDGNGDYLPHLLPVDPTLHWANPPGGVAGRDKRPQFTSTPGRYEGPVPIVTHVHGAVGVADDSDGYAEAWYLPAAGNIPPDYARNGTWYDFFRGKAEAAYRTAWGPGFATFEYPNLDRASTNWYHDHALGMTRVNVYAGPAGFFLIRGGPAGDLKLRDSRTGRLALLPRPAPSEIDQILPGRRFYEIPIAVQDRAFNADGSLFYPDTREFFDGVTGPFIPDTDISPIWNPEFFGNMLIANGNTWPRQAVEQRRYRLRFLNGCQARFLILDFSQIPGVEVWQIGNEGGFLPEAVNHTARDNTLLMGPAERADLIVDFTNVPSGSYVLGNIGPDEPYGGGVPGVDFDKADPQTTGQIMRFDVEARRGRDWSTPPRYLRLPEIAPLPAHTVVRPLALLEEVSEVPELSESPAETLLGVVDGDPNVAPGVWAKRLWGEPITENPELGATEIWELYNATGDAHPMHVHEVTFAVVNRQDIIVDEDAGTVRVDPASEPVDPEPWEAGFKDTVIAYPGQVTRVKAEFTTPGQYVWHCHIVEHEDNEMMRPYRIGPVQPGQPL